MMWSCSLVRGLKPRRCRYHLCRANALRRLCLLLLDGVILQAEDDHRKDQKAEAHEDAEEVVQDKGQLKDKVDFREANVEDVQDLQQVREATRICTWPGPQAARRILVG